MNAPEQSPPRSRSMRIVVVAALALLVCVYFGWRYYSHDGAANTSAGQANQQAPKSPAIPVTIAQVQTADFPVYLNGLGTVQPYATVTVRSRVDGEITKVEFKQGQMIKEGDVLVQIDPRPYQAALDQSLAKKAQDEANLKNAQLDLDRYTRLAKLDAGSQQQKDTQQAAVDQLTAQIKGDQAAIDNAQTQLSYATIRSPLSGKAGFRLVDPGNIVHATDTTGIVTIVKLQPISVVFTAQEDAVPAINKALAAGVVPVTALSSDGLHTLGEGHLAIVNNAVDQASGTISMKATFENKDNALWPGLSVATRLLVDTLKQVIVVPENAIQRGPNGLYTFVVGDDNKVTIQAVEVAQEGHGFSVVSKGVSAGQKVVTAGQYRLQQDSLVNPSEASSPAAPAQAANTTPGKEP